MPFPALLNTGVYQSGEVDARPPFLFPAVTVAVALSVVPLALAAGLVADLAVELPPSPWPPPSFDPTLFEIE